MNLFNTTTDSILGVFTKTIEKLEKHAFNQYSIGGDLRDAATVLNEKAAVHTAEAFKATAAARKLKAVIFE